MKTPKTDAEYIAQLERRSRRLENLFLPWQVGVGRYGDLVATNLDTGVRVMIAAKSTEPQNDSQE